MFTAVDAWARYADRTSPRRTTNAVGASTWLNWTQYPDHGPDESVLGYLRGRTVLELGSGTGSNLAHLTTLNATCIGVDLVPGRTAAARRFWGHMPNLDFETADVVDYLTSTPMVFDVMYSIFGAVWFVDPMVLLPLVRRRMAAGGVFAFSQLPVTADRSIDVDRAIRTWNYPAEQWARLLTEGGFVGATAEIIPAPVHGDTGTLFVRAFTR